ncbi:MAG: bifunctional heptose 7-phosphate kinase/heptose 1-phosphate adenyltransferase [Deltaproteobacteria bacterium]|nr:bifunctional heptose 7-phosphate kinase/heptose 1-phosphate adenyltransferase [Deltaproteobacteria bacterium]
MAFCEPLQVDVLDVFCHPGELKPWITIPYDYVLMAKVETSKRKGAESRSREELRLPETMPLRVVVAGEVILDRYVWGEVERISPEAPIPILRARRREEKPGNAGFVMANLRALGARPLAFSVVGDDHGGRMLRSMFRDLEIDTRGLLVDPDRPTIVKERMLGSVQSANRATQQLLRVDDEDNRPLAPERERDLAQRLHRVLDRADGVLVSDINKGLLTMGLLKELISGANRRRIPIVIDPRLSTDYSIYQGATAITPNRYETEMATGMKLTDRDAWRRAADILVRKHRLRACLVTLDRDGMYLAESGGRGSFISTSPREVYDVTGAGDVVLAVFGLLAIAGLGFASAAALANIAAGIEVGRLGTEIISRDDLARALAPSHYGIDRKIISVEELQALLEPKRRAGQHIVFTNGCFDLLHAGHLQLLSFARAQGDVLIVGINSDRSIRMIKGDQRPIYPATERARILAAIEMVDHVVVFDDPRAERVVREIRPDVLVKGADWHGRPVDGQEFVESIGGQVLLAPVLEGYSTTSTIARLREPKAAPLPAPQPTTGRDHRRDSKRLKA